MTRILISFFILALIFGAPALMAAEASGETRSMEVLADDLKFQNGVAFLKLKLYDKALETFNEYLEIFYNGTHRPEAFRNIAEIYFNRQEYLKAIEHYRALYEEFSNTESGVEAYYNIGVCNIKMGNEKKAAEIFNEILERHQDSAFRQQAELQLNMLNILQE